MRVDKWRLGRHATVTDWSVLVVAGRCGASHARVRAVPNPTASGGPPRSARPSPAASTSRSPSRWRSWSRPTTSTPIWRPSWILASSATGRENSMPSGVGPASIPSPLPDKSHRWPFYGQDDFTYDGAHDAYSCPAGHSLRRERVKHTERVIVYRADAATCNACPLKAKCTESSRGRIIHGSLYADYLERVRGYHATGAYKKAMRKRQVWAEPLFAEAKLWHGLRRFRRRGLENVNMEGLLIAAGQNLKRFLAATGWGRRHAPCGSLVALVRAPWRLAVVVG